MQTIPLDVLVGALNALDLVRKDQATPFGHVARCSIAAGQVQFYVNQARAAQEQALALEAPVKAEVSHG